MALDYQVFGPCTVQCGTGSANALEPLGVTTDGGSVALEFRQRPLISDAGGPEVPVEMQQFAARAVISFDLTAWDDAVLDKLIAAAEASATPGQAGAPGALLGAGGFLKALYLPSATNRPWYFPSAKLMSGDGKYGTEWTRGRLRFEAIRFLLPTVLTMSGVELFQRTAPA